MLKNGLLFGSFNPLHLSHIDLIGKALEYFEVLHIFARCSEGVDLVDWSVKKSWLERVNRKFDNRLKIYKLEIKVEGKQYNKLDLVSEFLKAEKQTGVHLDGLICGGDMQYMAARLQAALPDRKFVVISRDSRSSSNARSDIEAAKNDIPDFVYEDLKARTKRNGLLYGSFNPLHNSHVDLIRKGLEHFDTLHIFVRNAAKDDIVDFAVKKNWLETLNTQLDGRLRIYPLEIPKECVLDNGNFDMVKIFLHTEKQTGVHIDGLITGGDKDIWIKALKPVFPDREFVMIPRSDIRSHSIRSNLDDLRDEVPDFVYKSLKEKINA